MPAAGGREATEARRRARRVIAGLVPGKAVVVITSTRFKGSYQRPRRAGTWRSHLRSFTNRSPPRLRPKPAVLSRSQSHDAHVERSGAAPLRAAADLPAPALGKPTALHALKNASSSSFTWSFNVEHIPWGAPL